MSHGRSVFLFFLLLLLFPYTSVADEIPVIVGCEPEEESPYWMMALKASQDPVYPGIPGGRPFWNKHASRFIYAPAFHFPRLSKAGSYQFTARVKGDSGRYVFQTSAPGNALSPIWAEMECGSVELVVEALDSTGALLDTVGRKSFLKSPPFNGPYNKPSYPYREAGRRSLHALLHQEKIQYWLEHSDPDPSYPLWVHPTKIMGAVATGLIHYAHYFPDASDVRMAEEMARIAADYLLEMREPSGSPLEYWPPTYWNGVPPENHPVYDYQLMTNYPAEGGMVFLDMYDVTGEKGYYHAAVRIADTYVHLQDSSGTWPQLYNTRTGEPVTANLLIPTMVVRFFDRLIQIYEEEQYRESRDRAFQWCLKNPVVTYNWQGQYEDTRPRKPYRNMTREEAAEMSILLFQASDEHPGYRDTAEELLRFAEDQFVVWDRRDPVLRTPWFPEGSPFLNTDPATGSDWFLPAALEQYLFYTPISRSNDTMVEAYRVAHEQTGHEIYRAKAVSLANTLTRAQAWHGGGEIPTHLRRNLPEKNWINCGVYPALLLIRSHDWLTGHEEMN